MYAIREINIKEITPERHFALAFSDETVVAKKKSLKEVCEYLGARPRKERGGYSCIKGHCEYIITKE